MSETGFISRTVIVLSIIAFAFLSSCSKEIYNLSVKTVIADSKTKRPVPGAYLNVTCFYQDNIDNSFSEEKKEQSDVGGKVSVSFDKGYLLEVKASSPGYLNYKNKVLAKKRFPDTLFLVKEPEKTDLSLSILSSYNVTPNTPYIRIKKVIADDVKAKKQPQEIWGFDFINNKVVSDLDNADIWLDPKSTNTSFVFRTSEKGGIYPVYEEDLSQSFFLEIENVPELKYYHTYKTNGTERGYFILCRDGKRIVKMVPEDYLCTVEYQDNDKKIEESGIRLNYIIQKDTVNSNKFPLVVIYELLNRAQTTSMNTVDKNKDKLVSESF